MNVTTSRLQKSLAFLLIMMLMLSMSITTFAADHDLNLTAVDSSQYTVKVAPGQSVTLRACPANNYYERTSFDNQSTATAVNWSSTNTNTATVGTISHETVTVTDATGISKNILCSTAVITVPSTATIGSCSIEASRTNIIGNKASVNFTIIVDSSITADASGVYVMIRDFPNYAGETGKVTHSTQNFTTPLDVMKNLKASGSLDYTLWGTNYIAAITVGGETLTATGNYGWNYRIYRLSSTGDYLKVEDSEYIASDAFQIQDGDVIVWKYTTFDNAKTYFTENLVNLPAN